MAFQTVLISEDGVKVSETKLFDRKCEMRIGNVREEVVIDVATCKPVLDDSDARAREIVRSIHFNRCVVCRDRTRHRRGEDCNEDE